MSSRVYDFGPFRLDVGGLTLSRGDEAVPLTPKAFDLLVHLVENRDRPVGKAELMAKLWPERVVEESNLTQNVFLLRRVLGEEQGGRPLIVTVPRLGYRFVADVATPGDHASPEASAGRRPTRRRALLLLGLAGLALLGLALRQYLASAAPRPSSLVVLPFRVAPTTTADLQYLADGLTEALINQLSQAPGIHVIARTTAFSQRDRQADALKVGRELGVAWVVTGRLSREREATVLQLDLVETRHGTQSWGERFRFAPAELPDCERVVAGALASVLGLGGSAWARRPADHDPQAYEFYLQGRYFWNKRSNDGLRRSLELFRAALAREPGYAQAWSGLADTYAVLPEYGETRESEAYPQARQAAQKALELEPSLAEAHTSLAFVRFWWDRAWPDAERQFQHALQLNPGYATAHHWYGNALLAMGRAREGLAQLEEAQRSDPLSLVVGTELGTALYLARRYDEADARLARTLELDADFTSAHLWAGHTALALGHTDEALTHFRRARELEGTPDSMLGEMGLAEQAAGRTAEARDYLRRLDGLAPFHEVAYDSALLLAALGEREAALAALERAFQERSTDLAFIGLDQVFDPLREDPRFAALLRRLGQPRPSP